MSAWCKLQILESLSESLCFLKHEIMIEEEITGKDALDGNDA